MRFSTSGFFSRISIPRALENTNGPFRIFTQIRGDIRNFVFIAGINAPAISWSPVTLATIQYIFSWFCQMWYQGNEKRSKTTGTCGRSPFETTCSLWRTYIRRGCPKRVSSFFFTLFFYFLIIVFVQGRSPTPHPFSSRPHFVCQFSRQRSTKVF
jgi:hypothetical protein